MSCALTRLLLAGECNQQVRAAHQQRHLKHFRNAALQVVPAAGHFMFNDQLERSLGIVRAFLEGRERDLTASPAAPAYSPPP